MQVLLNTSPQADGRQSMAEYLESVVKEALGHYGERITRVEVHLSDAKSLSKKVVLTRSTALWKLDWSDSIEWR